LALQTCWSQVADQETALPAFQRAVRIQSTAIPVCQTDAPDADRISMKTTLGMVQSWPDRLVAARVTVTGFPGA
jgi:hypothetical protein